MEEIIENYGSFILGIIVVGALLACILAQITSGGLIFNLIEDITVSCIGG